MLKVRSLPLKVNFVDLSMVSSILFFLTHSAILSRSSCDSQYDFLLYFQVARKVNSSETFITFGRPFIDMQNSNRLRSDPWGTPLVTSKVLELQLSIPLKLLAIFKVVV